MRDIGIYLRQAFRNHIHGSEVKYFDPSYEVRSAPANASDSIFCARLAHNAVHAGMAGKTDMMLGRWYNKFTHVPLTLVKHNRKLLDPTSAVWRTVLEATRQPSMTV